MIDIPEDISNAAVFLAANRAGQIAGQTLGIRGEYTMIVTAHPMLFVAKIRAAETTVSGEPLPMI